MAWCKVFSAWPLGARCRVIFGRSMGKYGRRPGLPSLTINTGTVPFQTARSCSSTHTDNTTMSTIIPKSRVELHVHLDGALRTKTIIELGKKRGIKLPAETPEELNKFVRSEEGNNLTQFLATFSVFMPTIAGDEAAIRRMALEFCEDSANNGIVYSEVRYCPHLLASTFDQPEFTSKGDLSEARVVEVINEALAEGEKLYGIKVRSILCCMRHRPEWSRQMLELAVKYHAGGVVGIDLAGDENTFANPTNPEHCAVFQEAKVKGIHRTVHAGENGSAANVVEAMEQLCAERVGHGYHVLDDPAIYARVIKERLHLEVCPYSSFVTGSVPLKPEQHPVIRFANDGANFSINTDDPCVVGKNLSDEYELVLKKMNLTWQQVVQSNFNAAMSSFLPDDEKKALIDHLKSVYGKDTPEGV